MNIMTEFHSDLQKIFGNRYNDIVLYGSYVRGEFNPNTSDIDFVVFVDGSLQETDIQKLINLHEQYRESDSLLRLLEGRYIGIFNTEMLNGYYVGTSRSGWKEIFEMGFDVIESGMILDQYISYENHNIIERFLTVDWNAIKHQIETQVDDLLHHELFLQDERYTDYALVTCARSLYTYTRLGFVSKKEALSWIQDMGVYFNLKHPKKTVSELKKVFGLKEEYKIVDLKNIDLMELSHLLCNQNTGECQLRYFPKNATEIYERINDRLLQDNRDVKVVMLREQIVGFVDALVENEEHYIQVSSIFASGFRTFVWDCIFAYLKTTYKEYRLHIVLSDENSFHINYMRSLNAKTDGFERMLHIHKEWFKDSSQNNNIKELTSHQYDEFIQLHDHLYHDVYWNGNLLLESNQFELFSYMDLNQGYSIISSMNRDEEEIYFLHSKNELHKRELISHTLKHAFTRCTSVILLIDVHESSNITFYLDLGFRIKEIIIMFEIE